MPSRYKDREIRNTRRRNRYATDPEYRAKKLRNATPKTEEKKQRAYARARRNTRKRKIEVLTHYGKNDSLQCCWYGCQVTDIDMLTLDHKRNDGAQHRREIGTSNTYTWVKKLGFPEGFQTLCWNQIGR